MADEDIDNSMDNAKSSNVEDNVGTKKRKTHRLKQRFQVVKKLGQGTYGKVQLAINNETGQEVAIKTIKKNKVGSPQDLIRIRREIQIMSSIHHPHIIHIFEVFENKDKIVLVMQYASGGELYDYVSYHKVLSDTEARRLFRQIATAIYYCHKNKICHRDLKLENILLDEKGNAKIADFGLSNVFDEKHFLQTFCGSPLYASPEIVRGLPYFGPEVDCWSLGVLLYTLVYGAMPFDGSNFKKLVKQISEANYFEPPNKSAASDLIRKLLKPDPRERATIVDICTDEWVNCEYEHSLLQVAEDLSNLTPVRLDMLMTLAPVSPTETKQQDFQDKTNDKEKTETLQKDEVLDKSVVDSSNKRTVDNTSFNFSSGNIAAEKVTKKKSKKDDANEVKQEVPKPSTESNSDSTEKDISPSRQDNMDSNLETLEKQTEVELPQKATDVLTEKISHSSDDSVTDKVKTCETETVEARKEESHSNNKIEKNKSQSVSSDGSSSSISKRPGRLSIPKIWNNKNQDSETNSPNDTEKGDRKTPFISVGLRVSEAKNLIERRCSVDSSKSSMIKRRESLATSTELNQNKKVRDIKKYTTRSMSLNSIETNKSNKVKVTKKPISSKENLPVEKSVEKATPENVSTPQEQNDLPVTSTSTNISEEDKVLAKQILKKNIAKAKLMEKRQLSTNSNESETTPLLSIENSTVSLIQNTPISIDSSKEFTLADKEIKKDVIKHEITQPINAAPITRSYKKVTFTKDGACITESGKVFTQEGKDGITTRVERKSKVTHVISGNPNAISVQRSDSQSSSGSTDIFDDIFDDHWTGDVFFSNMKNLFNNIFDNSTRRINEKRSLRSRAESLERNNWTTRRPNRKSTFFNDEDFDRTSIFDSQQSLFSKSIFSSSFKSSFDKTLKLDDFSGLSSSSQHSERNAMKANYPLPKPSRIERSYDNELFSNSRVFNEIDQDQNDTTRKRVEQWLQSDDSKDFDNRLGTYGTIGPRNSRRYVRTMTTNDSASNFFKKVEIATSKNSSSSLNVAREVIPANSQIELKFNLNSVDGKCSVSKENVEENSSENEESSGNILKIPEQSSLLEQLRTIGYKNLVSRKLSESSSTDELAQTGEDTPLKTKLTEETTNVGIDTVHGDSMGSSSFEEIINKRKLAIRGRLSSVDMEPRQTQSNRSITNNESQEPDFKSETVQERIHRKSYYSRFNEDSRSSFSCRQRRRSMTRLMDEFSEVYTNSSSSSSSNICISACSGNGRTRQNANSSSLQSFLSFDPDRSSSTLTRSFVNSSSEILRKYEKSRQSLFGRSTSYDNKGEQSPNSSEILSFKSSSFKKIEPDNTEEDHD